MTRSLRQPRRQAGSQYAAPGTESVGDSGRQAADPKGMSLLRWFFLAVALLLVFRPDLALADEEVDKAYVALVEAARQNLDAADFGKLRELYAKSSFYKGDASDGRDLLIGHPSPDQVQKFLRENYGSIGAHLRAIDLLGYRKGTPEFKQEAFAAFKLFDVVKQSADGLSPETSYKVLAISEEYAICLILGLKVNRQSVVDRNGTSYDVLEVAQPGDSTTKQLWFDISAFYPTFARKPAN